ncbi:MAG: hypothetical protein PHH13_04935 [Candidatus Peribacteraceae bacterium]|nr:hypothetical protein [Candidatus Peribacteraceae bacterium]
MGDHPPKNREQLPTGPDKPCCQIFRAEISLGLSDLPQNVAELDVHQQAFKRDMSRVMTNLCKEFPDAIQDTTPGLGVIEVVASQAIIDDIVKKSGGRVLRLDHRGNGTDQEWPPPIHGAERAAA